MSEQIRESEEKEKIKVFAQCAMDIRKWEDSQLHLCTTRIGYDLFILIGQSIQTETRLTLKEVCNSLRYSDRGIRIVVEQFVNGGWCDIVGHDQDKRFRLVVPTQQLIDKFNAYEALVLCSYKGLCSKLD